MNTRVLLTLCGGALFAGSAPADELWRQSPSNAIGGYSSQDARNTGGIGWFSEVRDNFQGQGGSVVNQVEFWGGYASLTPGTMHGVSIRFYADNNGFPGMLLGAYDVLTFVEEPYYTTGFGIGYHYSVNLPGGFTVPTTGQHWVSVVGIVDRGGSSSDPQWGWITSAGTINPPPAKQRFFTSELETGADMSFVLNGTPPVACGTGDFDGDGDTATDFDIEAFFACISGNCCATCQSADFDHDGDTATDFDIEAFFRVIAGGTC